MRTDVTQFFNIQRSTIGLCPVCKAFFRLSDLRLIVKRGRKDFLDRMHDAEHKLEQAEERLEGRERELRQAARERGRAEVKKLIRRVDPIFAPRGLHAQDAQVLYQPIDFAVFDGLAETDAVRKIHLLDRKSKHRDQRAVQCSIETCIGRGRYDWMTLRVYENGKIVQE